jgi:hypothetical protein
VDGLPSYWTTTVISRLAPSATGGVTVTSPLAADVLATKLLTRTDFTGSRKSRLKLDNSWVVLARMVVEPDSRSVAGL